MSEATESGGSRKGDSGCFQTGNDHGKAEMTMSNKRFPKHCDEIKCSHYAEWDMSVDDYRAQCDLLCMGCDTCDEDISLILCPLSDEQREEFKK